MKWSKRFPEWLSALREEKRSAGRIPWLTFARSVFSGTVPRHVWRQRLRYGCYQCELFNRAKHTCRGTVPPYDQHGCNCYIPFSALTAEPYPGGCYGRAKFGPDFGWGTYQFPSRMARLLSPLSFLMRR